ncbi:MAG: T9SS type A sorting domain-containing protein [Chitinophagaceae bacterium]|nr:MAG: T9SS type A sorting domain-containing protein [Chitinophagaceae bacterium]
MIKILHAFTMLFLSGFFSFVYAQGESFAAKRVVTANTPAGRLRHPFAMVMGPDDSLWITERRGYVMKVSTVNGGKHQLLDARSLVRFTISGTNIKQDGMLGIALHPELNQGTGRDYVYLAYCYDSSGLRRVRIVRYNYNRNVPSLTSPVVLMRGIHGSDDHNGGKLAIGNVGTAAAPDYRLVYSAGDRGANQFGNTCDSIESQYIPTSAQVAAGDIRRYSGKILRMNLDGSIPADNPTINGTRSHIYSFGHRNPQGLFFERDDNFNIVPGGKLYSSEQGPATNDEINVIASGMNYGWPRVAGKQDNNWYKYYKWAGTAGCSTYAGECSSTQTGSGLPENSFSSPVYRNPIFDLYPGTPAGGTNCNWLANPTIAPSSVIHYPYSSRIPGWQNSLLITTLKTSAMYRLKLSADGSTALPVTDSVLQYFRDVSALNRYRDIALGSDGITIYLLTDSVGGTSGPSGGSDGGVTNRGAVLAYKYVGTVLDLGDDSLSAINPRLIVKIYPNPANNVLMIESKRNVAKPIYYQLQDAMGRPVLAGNSTKDKIEINVARLPRGVYSIKLFSGRDVLFSTQKVVLQ